MDPEEEYELRRRTDQLRLFWTLLACAAYSYLTPMPWWQDALVIMVCSLVSNVMSRP